MNIEEMTTDEIIEKIGEETDKLLNERNLFKKKLGIAMNRLQNLSQIMNANFDERIPADFIINWLDTTVDAIEEVK